MPDWPPRIENRPDSTNPGPTHAIIVPLEIQLGGCIEGNRGRSRSVINFISGSRTKPFTYLGVAICKREATGAVVVGGRSITPLGRQSIHDEKAIVDRIRVLVHCEPRHGRTGNLRS